MRDSQLLDMPACCCCTFRPHCHSEPAAAGSSTLRQMRQRGSEHVAVVSAIVDTASLLFVGLGSEEGFEALLKSVRSELGVGGCYRLLFATCPCRHLAVDRSRNRCLVEMDYAGSYGNQISVWYGVYENVLDR